LDIDDDVVALAHVDSFASHENHEFILAVASALDKLTAKFRIVLIGDGPLLYDVDWQVKLAGLSDRVILLGPQSNVPELLLAMDAFIFPSKPQAYSVAIIEAQAAGLVCFLADWVVPEAGLVPELLHPIPLEAGPEAWAGEIVAHGRAPISQGRALEQCLASDRGIEHCVARLRRIYTGL